MFEELDSSQFVRHYLDKALQELGGDPERFIAQALSLAAEQTDFFRRPGAALAVQAMAQGLLPKPKTAAAVAAAVPEPPKAAPQPKEEPAAAAAPEGAADGEACEEKPSGLKPNEGNGANLGRYSWTQSLQECVVSVPLPPGSRGRDCDVRITRGTLHAGIKGQPPVLDGELFAPVHADDSLWSVVDGKLLEISLQKVDGMQWWRAVVKGEPEINTQQVEPENSNLADLDPETRATVEKMMYDQRQKQMGLPTSDEQRKQDVLQQFMAAHPEMDFSNAKISGMPSM